MNTAVLWLGLRENQPVRSYFSTTLTLTLASVLLGMLLGLSLKKTSRRAKTVLITVSTAACLALVGLNFAFIPTISSFGGEMVHRYDEWDKREVVIETSLRSNDCQTKIPALPIRGMWVESVDSSYWVNSSLALYYHLPCSPAAQEQVPTDIFTPAG